MPRATIASRQLKNKDTGIDLFVTVYNEAKGMLTSTVYYQVVLVSNLACFKTPSHKESDVVQYSIEKQWSEFEDLRTKVTDLYHGTVLPVLNKKSIIVNDQVLRERRNNLDQLLKFLASVRKIATCAPLLEFLGVDSGRAKRFSQGEPLESTLRPPDDNAPERIAEADEPDVYVFEDGGNDETDNDLFGGGSDTVDDEDLFGAESNRVQVSMFEQQDMKRDLTEEDEKDFGYIPDAIITKRETIRVDFDESEDNSDLFLIEDDLDKLMTVDVRKKERQLQQKEEQSSPSSAPSTLKPSAPTKPSLAPKPRPPTKHNILSTSSSQDETKVAPKEPHTKPTIASRPKPAAKPRINQRGVSLDSATSGNPSSSEINLVKKSTDSGNVDILGEDDIMKYLRENSAASNDDVDLFS